MGVARRIGPWGPFILLSAVACGPPAAPPPPSPPSSSGERVFEELCRRWAAHHLDADPTGRAARIACAAEAADDPAWPPALRALVARRARLVAAFGASLGDDEGAMGREAGEAPGALWQRFLAGLMPMHDAQATARGVAAAADLAEALAAPPVAERLAALAAEPWQGWEGLFRAGARWAAAAVERAGGGAPAGAWAAAAPAEGPAAGPTPLGVSPATAPLWRALASWAEHAASPPVAGGPAAADVGAQLAAARRAAWAARPPGAPAAEPWPGLGGVWAPLVEAAAALGDPSSPMGRLLAAAAAVVAEPAQQQRLAAVVADPGFRRWLLEAWRLTQFADVVEVNDDWLTGAARPTGPEAPVTELLTNSGRTVSMAVLGCAFRQGGDPQWRARPMLMEPAVQGRGVPWAHTSIAARLVQLVGEARGLTVKNRSLEQIAIRTECLPPAPPMVRPFVYAPGDLFRVDDVAGLYLAATAGLGRMTLCLDRAQAHRPSTGENQLRNMLGALQFAGRSPAVPYTVAQALQVGIGELTLDLDPGDAAVARCQHPDPDRVLAVDLVADAPAAARLLMILPRDGAGVHPGNLIEPPLLADGTSFVERHAGTLFALEAIDFLPGLGRLARAFIGDARTPEGVGEALTPLRLLLEAVADAWAPPAAVGLADLTPLALDALPRWALGTTLPSIEQLEAGLSELDLEAVWTTLGPSLAALAGEAAGLASPEMVAPTAALLAALAERLAAAAEGASAGDARLGPRLAAAARLAEVLAAESPAWAAPLAEVASWWREVRAHDTGQVGPLLGAALLGSEGQPSPLVELAAAVVQLGRPDPLAEGPLDPEDWRAVLLGVAGFLRDEARGVGRILKIIERRHG